MRLAYSRECQRLGRVLVHRPHDDLGAPATCSFGPRAPPHALPHPRIEPPFLCRWRTELCGSSLGASRSCGNGPLSFCFHHRCDRKCNASQLRAGPFRSLNCTYLRRDEIPPLLCAPLEVVHSMRTRTHTEYTVGAPCGALAPCMLSATPHTSQGSVARWKVNHFNHRTFVSKCMILKFLQLRAKFHPRCSCKRGLSCKSVAAQFLRIRIEYEGSPASLVAIL